MTKQLHRVALAAGIAFLLTSYANAGTSDGRKSPSDAVKEQKFRLGGLPASTEGQRPQFVAFPDYKSEDCYRAPTYEAAYLCSAWRSAIAAEQAAAAAKSANDLALWALIFSAASVVGLIGTLIQASRSLYQSRRSANAAEKAIAQTRAVGEAQVRCYLAVSAASVAFYLPDIKPQLGLKIKNVGQSPAFDITWTVELQYSVLGTPDRRSQPLTTSISPLTLPPGTDVELIPEVFDFALNIAEQAHVAGPGDVLGTAAKITILAKDVFGKEVRTQVLYFATVEDVDTIYTMRFAGNGLPTN